MLPALEAQSLNHWTTRKVPRWFFLTKNHLSKEKRKKVSEGGGQRAVKTRGELQSGVEKRYGQNS